MRRIVDVVASQGHIQKVGVAEGDAAPEIMTDLVRMVGERIPDVRIDRSEIGIVLGTHAGPGVFGVASFLERWNQRIASSGRADLVGVAQQVLVALDGYAGLTPAARAERIETA